MTARFSSELLTPGPLSPARAESASQTAAPEFLPSVPCEVMPALPVRAGAERAISATDDEEVYVPESYEPNYAYPLIVWLAPSNAAPIGLHRLMSTISERNYFGVALPYRNPDELQDNLPALFTRLRRKYHLHTERVFLAGIGPAGTQALVTGLTQPDWFGGIAALSAGWPDSPRLLRQIHELRGKHVLIGVDAAESASVIADALYSQQLLWSAGMHVAAVAAGGPDSQRSLLREMDRWIMQTIDQPELVC